MDKKPSILIVDDDEGTASTLRLILRKEGYGAETAGSGRDAIEKAQESSFNLALLDIKLPDMQGTELIAPFKESCPDMVIIMVTAYASVETAIQALNKGASAYITKPLDMDEVLATVREALEKQRLVQEKREAEEELLKTSHDLKQTVEDLRKANKTIREQQKSVIEEERLKVLLQMAGATAHELNQPLTALLGSIDLVRIHKDAPEKLLTYMKIIEESGNRISNIIRKIETIRHDETRPYIGDSSIINLDQKINILSVEESDEDFETIDTILKDNSQITLSRVNSVGEAVEVLQQGDYDLVLLDYLLPDGNGLDFLRMMDEKRSEIPVVVLRGEGDEITASQVIQAGAYDYLPKEMVNSKSLSGVISSSLEKFRLKKQKDEAQKKIVEMATTDELTGLYNRRYFMEALEREVSRAKRYETDLAFCMIDLDHFKRINDTYGHPAGDRVLLEIGKIFKECIRQSDLAGRYGGEEFALILPSTQTEEAYMVCERLRDMVSQHQFKYNLYLLRITTSIGIASFNPSNPEDPVSLIYRADEALYQAKEAGRNRVVEYQQIQELWDLGTEGLKDYDRRGVTRLNP